MYPHQAERLTAALERHALDALVASSPENVLYVTGFASAVPTAFRALDVLGVFTRRGVALVVPMIDAVTLAADPADVDLVVPHGEFFVEAGTRDEVARRLEASVERRAAEPLEALRRALGALGAEGGRMGLDESGLTVRAWNALASLAPRPAAAALDEARVVKSPYEIECLDRALRIAEEGANAVMQMLKPGVTEREAAALYAEDVVKRGGSPDLVLVGFGAGAALPAAAPSDRALRGGDLVRLHLGASARGYRADVARTAVMGVPGERQERVYEAIDAAQQAALDALTAGAAAQTVFEAALAAARARDLPSYRRHHVGHGIGLAHREPPLFRPGETTAIEAGMVVQVENSYHEHGWGGVHLKDTALVTRAGARVMNRTARGLVVLD